MSTAKIVGPYKGTIVEYKYCSVFGLQNICNIL